jgi:hypothetical protein
MTSIGSSGHHVPGDLYRLRREHVQRLFEILNILLVEQARMARRGVQQLSSARLLDNALPPLQFDIVEGAPKVERVCNSPQKRRPDPSPT